MAEHGFVLLLGEPACGKSTIAAALAVGALDERGCSTFKIRDADDFITHSNPHEPRQFFWVDDAFGATQFDWMSAANWNRVFPHIQAAIRRGAKVLFTSRDYIYRSARQLLKETALPVIRESQVVIQVEELTKEEREQILYNHIRLGSQPKSVKSELKPFLSKAAAHQRFSPEIARRLGNPLFTKRLYISESGLDAFIAHPVELLCEIIRTLDSGSRSALALVFMRGGMLPSPIGLSGDEERAATLLGGSLSDVRTALNALDGSLLVQSLLGGKYSWRFPNLGGTISAWRSNFRSDDDPESHFDDLVSVLKRYQEEFADAAETVTQITSALAQIDVVIEELRSEQPQEPDSDDYRGHDSPTLESDDSRSVFDDVDQ